MPHASARLGKRALLIVGARWAQSFQLLRIGSRSFTRNLGDIAREEILCRGRGRGQAIGFKFETLRDCSSLAMRAECSICAFLTDPRANQQL
jgi:hypothetical protein